MSYTYRKEKRVCADWILSVLCGNPLVEVSPMRVDWDKYKYDIFTTRQLMGMDAYKLEELNDAIRLLSRHGHIRSDVIKEDQSHKSLFATIEGQDAYFESYYLKENQKDRLESIELYTKWMLPILSIVIALSALVVSIAFHK